MSEFERIIEDRTKVVHFVGVGGAGMSALAQYHVLGGAQASGSDRSFDRGEQLAERAHLVALGIRVTPQDGSGVDGAAAVVASTAVESAIPDLLRARERGLVVAHRADLLAAHVRGPSVAVAGTSGKSTVTAMVFEILCRAGRDPGLISGGRLRMLMRRNMLGNAWRGQGPLVVEADESDGSLVRHHPRAAVVLNLARDHMESDRVLEQFRTFRKQTRGPFVVGDEANLAELRDGAVVFGFGDTADVRATDLHLGREASTFRILQQEFHLPLPGRHNARNALAAVALCLELGVEPETAAEALASYGGVFRRFERIGVARGVEIIDDFAHNPDKLAAILTLATSRAARILVYFQPHGYAPTRFQRADLVRVFAERLRPADRLWLAPIYYSGGTVERDISSADLIEELAGLNAPVSPAPDRARFVEQVEQLARPGDTVLILGARDPTLPELAHQVLSVLS